MAQSVTFYMSPRIYSASFISFPTSELSPRGDFHFKSDSSHRLRHLCSFFKRDCCSLYVWSTLLRERHLSRRPKVSTLYMSVSVQNKHSFHLARVFELPWPAVLLQCVCTCVCVWFWGRALFCLPLSIAVSCPFLSQHRKEPHPLGPGLVYVHVWCLALLGF